MHLVKMLSFKQITKNFKVMPVLLKVIFVIHTSKVGVWLLALITQKSIQGATFAQMYPMPWSLLSIFMSLAGLYVFLRRSHSLLVKYAILGAILLAVSLFINVYSLQLTFSNQVHIGFLYYRVFKILLAFFVVLYPLTQKKYFNQEGIGSSEVLLSTPDAQISSTKNVFKNRSFWFVVLGGLVGLAVPIAAMALSWTGMFLNFPMVFALMTLPLMFLCSSEDCFDLLYVISIFVGWMLCGMIVFYFFEKLLKLFSTKK